MLQVTLSLEQQQQDKDTVVRAITDPLDSRSDTRGSASLGRGGRDGDGGGLRSEEGGFRGEEGGFRGGGGGFEYFSPGDVESALMQGGIQGVISPIHATDASGYNNI